jgi:hypothetical protein
MRYELNSSLFYIRSQEKVAQSALDYAKQMRMLALDLQKSLLTDGFQDLCHANFSPLITCRIKITTCKEGVFLISC